MDGYVWQQAGGRRHGRIGTGNATLPAGRTFRTLCGRQLTVEERDDHTIEGCVWTDATCSACDYKMRRALNRMPQSPEYRAALAAPL